MKRIRKRPRIDNLDRQQRAGSGKLARVIYLGLLAGFVCSIAYYFVGGMFVLSADGIVLNDRHTVAARYSAIISKVFVSEGDTVSESAPLLELESLDMVKEIADLTVRNSELAVQEGTLRGQSSKIAILLPLAERSAEESTESIKKLDLVSQKGLVSSPEKSRALAANYEAAERYADLVAQAKSAEAQLRVVDESRRTAEQAVKRLEAVYDEGRVRAGVAGIIGSKVPTPGQAVRFGDELLQINGGKPYLLAYLPDQYLFSVHAGMKVNVRGGGERAVGTVEKVLQIADALPDEFQNMLRPRDRSRLVRITLPENHPFAVSQKVVVEGCGFGFCWVNW